MHPTLIQYPETGKHILRYCGDILEVRLRCDRATTGKAFLCTNIGRADLQRSEIIEQAESNIAASAQDWSNLPMEKLDDYSFRIRLALNEEGHFECKACLIEDDESHPVWADGDNLHVNVSSAAYCCANSVYCAFVRQFGMNQHRPESALPADVTKAELEKFDKLDYALIPPSGTFRSLIKELDHIIGTLRCRIIHLLPVTPTPSVFARMGRYGSPYASLDFTSVDSSLAEFDKKATPLDQFMELADAIHAKNARLFIDIAINHTGWASKLQEEHPEWFVKESDGTFHSPGAWGVVWGDLVELDHGKYELWQYLADVFLTWCSRGVDGFRCDAGYMIPKPAWKYIIARVRREYPETIFLLEGLGGDPAVTSLLLDRGNMDWAYSELFQNYSRSQVEGYLQYAWRQSASDGLLIHYAETHDNSRLAAVSEPYAKMRTALCALSSVSGAFGFANGVEWYAKEKIDVHESCALNWGAEVNQVEWIAKLNTLLAVHPAFHDGALLQMLDSRSTDGVVFLRETAAWKDSVIVAVNLNWSRTTEVFWDSSYLNADPAHLYDLLTGQKYTPRKEHQFRSIVLAPGEAVCLSENTDYLDLLEQAGRTAEPSAEKLEFQKAKSMVLSILCKRKRTCVMQEDEDITTLTGSLIRSPENFLEKMQSPCIRLKYPVDSRRQVMIPPEHCILASADAPFRIIISDTAGKVLVQKDSLKDSAGCHFVLIPPFEVPGTHTDLHVVFRAYGNTEKRISEGRLLLLASDTPTGIISYTRKEIYNHDRTVLQSNGKGAIMHQCMELERLNSRYDAILLANLSPEYPEDRHIMWRRIRIWIGYLARYQELKHEHIESFHMDSDGGSVWHYHVPAGNGLLVPITLKMRIVPGKNAVLLSVSRDSTDQPKRLPDDTQIRVFLRPDIEDRNFHHTTKASTGPEKTWPDAVKYHPSGFDFVPVPDRILHMQASCGNFKPDPEWIYMVWQKNEAERGLDPYSDLFSPGTFRFYLNGGETAHLAGQVLRSPEEEHILPVPLDPKPAIPAPKAIESVMIHSMRQFVVDRSGLKTVIAGYPWFLDWGRDTLIAARGLIAVPEFRDDAAAILLQFASFAENGTIPNMIAGGCASNRDTSDAPLWLYQAAADYCNVTGSKELLKRKVRNGDTLIQVLSSLAEAYAAGTPNGIRMDEASGLIFSPPHFTWMDTNYPAGTPREGYPVEIQALWHGALRFLAQNDTGEAKRQKWSALADKVSASFHKYFVLPEEGYLSDCLHASFGTPAAEAEPDDHLRSNQLLAVTLGLVRDHDLAEKILKATQELLIPGAIRSLADREYKYALPIRGSGGVLLNDPHRPYRPRYEGDEDTSRKVAYHNGTAWTWPFPSWSEACYMVRGLSGRKTAISVLSSMTIQMDGGCITQLPEILDGDYPHTPRGCDAQAWGITEYYRVWALLHRKTKEGTE